MHYTPITIKSKEIFFLFKLFKEQIGKNLALGIKEGFSDQMVNVAKDMKSAIPTDFDLDLNPNVQSEFSNLSVPQKAISIIDETDYIISAFQKALSGMAFQIDSDKMGEMVVNKVERVVFA